MSTMLRNRGEDGYSDALRKTIPACRPCGQSSTRGSTFSRYFSEQPLFGREPCQPV